MAQKVIESVKLDYDAEGDVLYIYFDKPYPADDSNITDEGVIIRTRGDKIVGFTILNAQQHLFLGNH